MLYEVILHTDGACSNNGYETAVGGWCAILLCKGKEMVLHGYESRATNNRMELRAVIEGIKALKKPSQVSVYTDSQYVCQGAALMRKWLKHPQNTHANMDLWNELIAVGNKGGHKITFHKVTGHSGDPMNERCDAIAKQQTIKYSVLQALDEA